MIHAQLYSHIHRHILPIIFDERIAELSPMPPPSRELAEPDVRLAHHGVGSLLGFLNFLVILEHDITHTA